MMNKKSSLWVAILLFLVCSALGACVSPGGGGGGGGSNGGGGGGVDCAVPEPNTIGSFHGVVIGGTIESFKLIQPVPPDYSRNISLNMGLTFFFNDKLDPDSINGDSLSDLDDDPIKISTGGCRIFGTFTAVLTPAGFTCLSFTPYEPFPQGQLITVTLLSGPSGLTDDDTGTLDKLYTLRFSVMAQELPPADGNLSFESGFSGWGCSGDCGQMDLLETGIIPANGSFVAALTTHNTGITTIPPVSSLTDTTSILSSGPITIPPGMTKLVFDYKLISSEFKEFMNSAFDDSFIVSISGTSDGATLGGIYANITDSVNMSDAVTMFPTAFPNMPDEGDDYAGETPWITETISVTGLVGPIYVTFIVSDVGDTIYSTIAIVDNIRFAP